MEREKMRLHHYNLDDSNLGTVNSLSKVHQKYYNGAKYSFIRRNT